MSFGSPFGAPASTHFTMVSISLSDSERSFSNSWMPTVLSMCHGGICRALPRLLIDRAQGRASSNETSDIGAIESGRWQASHLFWKIGAMSLVKVGLCAAAAMGIARTASNPTEVTIRLIFRLLLKPRDRDMNCGILAEGTSEWDEDRRVHKTRQSLVFSGCYGLLTDRQRQAGKPRCTGGYAPVMGASRHPEPQRHQVRLRHRRLRRLHGSY